jgi:hypothetical protein
MPTMKMEMNQNVSAMSWACGDRAEAAVRGERRPGEQEQRDEHAGGDGKRAHGRCHSMKVTAHESRRTIVQLPGDVARPFEVYVNGVLQREGVDYRVETGRLVFDRELRTEGKLGFWRWLSMWVGVAGTYRQNDSVDVVYERNGRKVVAAKLPLQTA